MGIGCFHSFFICWWPRQDHLVTKVQASKGLGVAYHHPDSTNEALEISGRYTIYLQHEQYSVGYGSVYPSSELLYQITHEEQGALYTIPKHVLVPEENNPLYTIDNNLKKVYMRGWEWKNILLWENLKYILFFLSFFKNFFRKSFLIS